MIYLIKRGPKPEYHRAPFHPVIVCDNKRIAKWEAGWTGDRAWVWENHNPPHGGLLIVKWEGLDVDYGHMVRACTLPDGRHTAFYHEHDHTEVWELYRGAVWWSHRVIPAWLAERGVVYPPDGFTQQRILDDVANDGSSGWLRPRPAHWPEPTEAAEGKGE